MTAVATGTAVYVNSLPAPPPLKVFRNLDIVDEEDKKLVEIQKMITHLSEQNRKQLEWCLIQSESGENNINSSSFQQGLSPLDLPTESIVMTRADESDSSDASSSSSLSDEEDLNRSFGNLHVRRHTTVVQIDDEQDESENTLSTPALKLTDEKPKLKLDIGKPASLADVY